MLRRSFCGSRLRFRGFACAIPCRRSVLCEIYFFKSGGDLSGLLLITCVLCLFGLFYKKSLAREAEFKAAFDRERSLRYELERVKARLLSSSCETSRSDTYSKAFRPTQWWKRCGPSIKEAWSFKPRNRRKTFYRRGNGTQLRYGDTRKTGSSRPHAACIFLPQKLRVTIYFGEA